MKSYLLCAAGAIFLSVIVTLLVPEGKLNKTITFVMRLVCIFVLIQPVTQIFDLDVKDDGASIVDYSYVESAYSEHQSGQLENLLFEEFGERCECGVEVEYADGEFNVSGVEVELFGADEKLFNEIEAYLTELGYINISVYATRT